MRTLFLLSLYVLLSFTSPVLANITKSRIFGGDSTEYYNSCISLQNGTTVLINSTSTESKLTDVWLIAVDSTGDSLWSKTFGTADRDNCVASLKTSDSGFYLVIKESKNDVIRDRQCNYRLIRFNDSGDILWSNIINSSGTGLESFAGIFESPDNNIVIAGSKYSDADGNDRIWIIKISPTGEILLKKE